MNPGLALYKLGFQLSPIIFVDGIATNIPGKMLPIIAITEAANFIGGLVSGSINIELDGFFANFQPMPGSTLIDNQIGTYPFANQTVAANALVSQPLTLSMLMICPARNELGYALKLLTMMALQAAISNHNYQGGTYTIMTPSYIYTNGIMTGMRDVSSSQSKQTMWEYQIDFQFPLLTVEQANAAQANLISQITNGSKIVDPAWSGPAATLGLTGANSLAATSAVPAAAGLGGVGITPLAGFM